MDTYEGKKGTQMFLNLHENWGLSGHTSNFDHTLKEINSILTFLINETRYQKSENYCVC